MMPGTEPTVFARHAALPETPPIFTTSFAFKDLAPQILRLLHPMNWIFSLGFVAAYLLLDAMSYIHPLAQSTITPWNPQPALAIALLMIRGQRWALLAAARKP